MTERNVGQRAIGGWLFAVGVCGALGCSGGNTPASQPPGRVPLANADGGLPSDSGGIAPSALCAPITQPSTPPPLTSGGLTALPTLSYSADVDRNGGFESGLMAWTGT